MDNEEEGREGKDEGGMKKREGVKDDKERKEEGIRWRRWRY